MSKKTNTVLFILGGTVVNILITIICFFILMIIYGRIYTIFPEGSEAWMLPVIFILSIVASFFVYKALIKFISKKIDMEKYFDPIFGSRRQPPRKPQ
uniref:Leader peptide processing enzyme n=1 Tax=uncultured bacterium contig00086 TaxID=1181559 RepID=A0A806KKJ4_9BACT|nr:hypothetical protein [uncultured bacterium contig00086]